MNCLNCGSQLPSAVKFCPRCGTPTGQPVAQTPPPQPPPYAPPQMQTSWDAGGQQHHQQYQQGFGAQGSPPRRKSRAGKILLIVLGVLVVLGVAAAGAVYVGYKHLESTMKTSDAYLKAEETLKGSKAVAERMGEIKSTGFPVGSYNTEAGGGGFAGFTVSVEGTKASGRYYVAMRREGGQWRVLRAHVQLQDGETVSVVEEQPEGRDAYGQLNSNTATNANVAGNANASRGVKSNVISGGVLNGKAISKPMPPYPAIAKAAKAQGTVTVQVVVDEKGNVISASAVSGHPLLQQAAVTAARSAKFSPTLLSGKPVKVSGVITYNFVLE